MLILTHFFQNLTNNSLVLNLSIPKFHKIFTHNLLNYLVHNERGQNSTTSGGGGVITKLTKVMEQQTISAMDRIQNDKPVQLSLLSDARRF